MQNRYTYIGSPETYLTLTGRNDRKHELYGHIHRFGYGLIIYVHTKSVFTRSK